MSSRPAAKLNIRVDLITEYMGHTFAFLRISLDAAAAKPAALCLCAGQSKRNAVHSRGHQLVRHLASRWSRFRRVLLDKGPTCENHAVTMSGQHLIGKTTRPNTASLIQPAFPALTQHPSAEELEQPG